MLGVVFATVLKSITMRYTRRLSILCRGITKHLKLKISKVHTLRMVSLIACKFLWVLKLVIFCTQTTANAI